MHTEQPGGGSESTHSAAESSAALPSGDLRYLDPSQLLFSRKGARLRVQIADDCCYLQVTPHRIFPLSEPSRYISLMDGNGKEIGIIVDAAQLSDDNYALLSEEIERRYVVPLLEKLVSLKERFGTLEWLVETDRGPRRFTTRDVRDNALIVEANRCLITDVEGNRYEIRDMRAVDPAGRLLRYL